MRPHWSDTHRSHLAVAAVVVAAAGAAVAAEEVVEELPRHSP